MRVGLCYDTKEDYGITPTDMHYTDFATLSTVTDIASALAQAGHSVRFINGINELKEMVYHSMLPDVDIVFNIAEGFGSRNREGLVPAFLEAYGIPYSGSDAYAMSLTLNKYHTKILAEHIGIPTPLSYTISSVDELPLCPSPTVPMIIKPNYEGGSMGVQRYSSLEELSVIGKKLFAQYHGQMICEEYIEGTEVTVPVIGNGAHSTALCVVAARHTNGDDIDIYTSDLKYFGDIKLEVMDNTPVCEKLLKYSRDMHIFLGLRDYSRFDYRINKKGIPYLLEINPMPSLDRDDTFEVYALHEGMQYYQVIDRILMTAVIRNRISAK